MSAPPLLGGWQWYGKEHSFKGGSLLLPVNLFKLSDSVFVEGKQFYALLKAATVTAQITNKAWSATEVFKRQHPQWEGIRSQFLILQLKLFSCAKRDEIHRGKGDRYVILIPSG